MGGSRHDRVLRNYGRGVVTALRLHGYLFSTFTRTVAMTCIEKGVPYELVPIAYGGAEHAALHPFLRIPVLEHDGSVVFETLAITDHVDEAFHGPPLQPAPGPARTRMLQWVSLCSDYIYRDVVRGLPRKRLPTEDELGTARRALERVDATIDAPYLAGESLSLADLYLAPQISNAREKAPEILASLDATEAWFATLAARESFLRTSYDPDRAPR
jgi:glutathione S-transferase